MHDSHEDQKFKTFNRRENKHNFSKGKVKNPNAEQKPLLGGNEKTKPDVDITA